jgi:hypothetical protein
MPAGEGAPAGPDAERPVKRLSAVGGLIAVLAIIGVVGTVAVITGRGEQSSPYADEDTFVLIDDLVATSRDLPFARLDFHTRISKEDGPEFVAAGELVVDGPARRSRYRGASYGTPVEQIVVATTAYLRLGDDPEWWQVDVEHARDMLEPVAPALTAGIKHEYLRGTTRGHQGRLPRPVRGRPTAAHLHQCTTR